MINANKANFLSDFYSRRNYKKEIRRIEKSIKYKAKAGSKYLNIYFNDDDYYMYCNIYDYLKKHGYNVTIIDKNNGCISWELPRNKER